MSKRQRAQLLYHFSCEHGHRGISASHALLPHPHPFMPALGPLLWLTDLAEPPDRESLGLTANLSSCDRMAYRYVVRTRAAVSWADIRRHAPSQVVRDMEAFGMPAHWWVVRRPLVPSEFWLDTSWKPRVAVEAEA